MPPPPPWSLVYADGAANVYRFEATADEVEFAYEPVTPTESSTGRYSGGAPRQERLRADDLRLAALWRAVDAAVADRAHHAPARIKGDGAITVVTAAGTRQVLVVRAATRALEALLEQRFRPAP
ncbi:MAG: hypothetical protein IPL61_37515 [Myxococcales bacterium]|nr:hypothetical protein [Myxococcales bacterium]